MMHQQVIVTQIRITKAGQSRHFQVRLPKNTKGIIGIEVGSRLIQVKKREEAAPVEQKKPVEAIEKNNGGRNL